MSFRVKIITPEDVFFDGETTSLIAPGAEGYLGVLKDHAPLVTPLEKGTVTLKSAGAEKHFEINDGFLEVSKNQAVILVERISEATAAASRV